MQVDDNFVPAERSMKRSRKLLLVGALVSFTIGCIYFFGGSDQPNTPQMLSETTQLATKMREKQGIMCVNCVRGKLDLFAKSVSWYYRYGTNIDQTTIDWLNENKIEYVYMWSGQKEYSLRPLCYWNKAPFCTVDYLVDGINKMQDKLTVKGRYVMMFNEAYTYLHTAAGKEVPALDLKKKILPKDMVEYIRKTAIPASKKAGLQLVTFTMMAENQPVVDWQAEIFAECYKLRNDPEFPCDVTAFKRFAMHSYKCQAQFWQDYFDPKGKNAFQTATLNSIKNRIPENFDEGFWRNFLENTPIWVTETSCTQDAKYDKSVPYPKWPFAPSNIMCKRMTGQLPESHGKGSLRQLTQMPNIERWAWWGGISGGTVREGQGQITLYKPEKKSGYTDLDRTPVGRALNTPYNQLKTLDCDYNYPEGKNVENNLFQ